jgi:hypothetical protein
VLDAEIAAGSEADVPTRVDVRLDIDRAPVVDDDDLVRLAGERVEAPLEMVAAVVRDDDDGDAQ